jgi:hypothetical protein
VLTARSGSTVILRANRKGGCSEVLAVICSAVFLFCRLISIARGENLPAIRTAGSAQQLIVGGKPFLILGCEPGNSSAGTAAPADVILPKLARMHFNTLLVPVAWNQIEPKEGSFDFAIPDHLIDVVR